MDVVCGRKKIRKEKSTAWWSKEVEVAVKSKKEAYKRWLQVKTEDAKEVYLKAKRAASHTVRKAKNEELARHCREISNTIRGGFGRR